MDEAEYNAWWLLHIRSAKGEVLSKEEQTTYEAALRAMDAEEEELLRDSGIEQMRLMRAQIIAAEAEQQHLLARQAQIKARIAALEARLDDKTRRSLGIGN